jgi:TolB-like protein/Flp pilus assembly protein TadD
MEADEAGTLAQLKAHREVTDSRIGDYGGRIVGTAGDGLLVEFPSVSDAVACALEVQALTAERNADLPAERRMEFRIGINLGDVMIEGDDIFGTGINVAARLQALAEPGGICVSQPVRDQIRHSLGLACDDLGNQTMKNIAEPVRAFRVQLDGMKPGTAPAAARATPALELPDKPSIAVLPFDNMSGDPEQEYFSDGISEDIITALSRFHLFFVIARNTSFTYKGKAVDVRQVSRDLGVRYVLEGSVRRAGSRVRITAQLVDAIADHHVWAERYDREVTDVFDVQDEITESIAMTVAPELQAAEMQRARRKSVPELGVWDLVARATWHMARFTEADNGEAQRLLNKALELDEGSAVVFTRLANCISMDGLFGWHRPPPESLAKAAEMAQRAIVLDKQDEEAHGALGLALFFAKQHDKAIERLETAIAINPNNTNAIGSLGCVFAFAGERDRAFENLNKAIRLSPRDPYLYFFVANLGFAEFVSGRLEDAIEWAQKSIHENPGVPTGYRLLAACCGLLGRPQEARAALEHLQRLLPGATIKTTMQAVPFKHSADAERYVEGLRKAGLPK